MKTKNRLFSFMAGLLSLALPIAAVLASSPAHAGGGEGNGGDSHVEEFVRIARQVHEFLSQRPADAEPKVDPKVFSKALESATIYSVDEILYLRGIPKDVINYPSLDKIAISRPRWRSTLTGQKPTLVLHELLPMMGINDTNYVVTTQLAAEPGFPQLFPMPIDANDRGELERQCSDATATLRLALSAGLMATKAVQERAILIQGIVDTLQKGTPRFAEFFAASLNSALADVLIFDGKDAVKKQVRLLRSYIGFAIDDFAAVGPSSNPSDYGPYVNQMLKRSINVGLSAETAVEELNLLTRAAQRGIALLRSSDYGRANEYVCRREALLAAIAKSSDTAESPKERAISLRNALVDITQMAVACN